ncbi:MAG: PIN domain-containing protein [Candidatus Altiarchaeota archaeon]|nr:PIN domain-containing protein [Candidatus Altiarchaeota archaeon]MBU4341196.1 PIN domain-containing protein [Candidatus Altiarchaeota archaeon]MBU4406410.1 PIN domain-containing protein [Candidatus Altiarchaeota archaeon]
MPSLSRIAIDSEIFVIYFKEEEDAERIKGLMQRVRDNETEAIISSITLSEVYYSLARYDQSLAEEVLSVLKSQLKVIPVNIEIAELTGEFKYRYSKAGDPLPIADAIIAATAKIENVSLLAEDPHFDKIKEVDTVSIDDL